MFGQNEIGELVAHCCFTDANQLYAAARQMGRPLGRMGDVPTPCFGVKVEGQGLFGRRAIDRVIATN